MATPFDLRPDGSKKYTTNVVLRGSSHRGLEVKMVTLSTDHSRTFVIKEIPGPDMFGLGDQWKRTKREVEVMDGLKDPGSDFVVLLHDSWREPYVCVILMDYCRHGDLNHMIMKYSQFRIDLVRQYTAETIKGLEYLQSKKVVHRDLKPMNLYVADGWHLKIGDFGSSFFLLEDGLTSHNKSDVTRYKHMLREQRGTANYMSPEVYSEDEYSVGFGTDLWALGCIVFEIHTGNKLFDPTQNKENLKKSIKSFSIPIYPELSNASKEDPGQVRLVRDLIEKLMVQDAHSRLGATDVNQLKRHQFFQHVDWDNLHLSDIPSREMAIYNGIENSGGDSPGSSSTGSPSYPPSTGSPSDPSSTGSSDQSMPQVSQSVHQQLEDMAFTSPDFIKRKP